MPFDNTATKTKLEIDSQAWTGRKSEARLLDDGGKVKYDLTTGKGRLAYLADQLEARRPAGFNMGNWEHCAIGEGRKMEALVAAGLPRGMAPLSAFFGLSVQTACYLFGDHPRTVDQEVAEIRAHIHHAT